MSDATTRPGSIDPSTQGRRAFEAAVALAVFTLALISHRVVAAVPGYVEGVVGWPDWARGLLQPLRWALLVLAGLLLVGVRPGGFLRDLGLAVPPRQAAAALAFALACSTPLLLLGILAGIERPVRPGDLLFAAGIRPIAEEILFRGYAFGHLVRRARWNVWAAALVTGAIFGAVHLFNSEVQFHEVPGRLLSIGLIGAGGVAYAWLFYRWRFDLWIAIGMHGFMNLWYALFAVGETPIGSKALVLSRIAVVAIAITATEMLVRLRWSSDVAPRPSSR